MNIIDRLNRKEKETIENLRERMKNIVSSEMYDDILVFYRFLKARNFNVDKAETMLKKHIIWRKALQIDCFLEIYNYTEVFAKYLQPTFLGFDKDGDSIRYCPLGKTNPADVLKCMKMNDYTYHIIYWIEQDNKFLKRENEKKGRMCYQTNFIFDLDNLTYADATNITGIQLMIPLINILQDNYPERAKAVYVINAPAYFYYAFSVLKAIMTNATKRKFRVFGKTGWKEALLEAIDADVLPVSLGGKRTDPDCNPFFLSSTPYSGEIPPKYYLSNEDRRFRAASTVEKITVPPKSKIQIPVDVTEPGSLIQWEFETKSKDIGFGLYYEKGDQELEVLPILKRSTADGTETGSYKSKIKGTYIIIFDNSDSWLTSKEVHYCITVISSN